MRYRRATENSALIPAIVEAVNFFPDYFCFPVKGEGARGKRLVVPKGTADILGVMGKRVLLRAAFGVASMLPGAASPQTSTEVMDIGQAFAVETKWSHRSTCLCKSCQAQRLWRFQWEKRGGLYILARSPQEAIDGLMGRRAA